MTTPEPAMNDHDSSLTPCGLALGRVTRTIEAVRAGGDAARLRLSTRCRWRDGHRSEAHVTTYRLGSRVVGDDRHHLTPFDESPELGGTDTAPTPSETLLSALAACVLAATHANAAIAGVTLTSLEVVADGELDLRGIFGLAPGVRPGLARIELAIRLSGDAPPDALRAIAERGVASSAVRDTLAAGVPIAPAIHAE